jgi:penicillin-binding protein 1A
VLIDDAARAYVFGRGSTLTLPDRQVAAKTGTTNNNKDAWTLGYVPSLAAGVWVGNTMPSPMKGGGSSLAGKIWNRFMKLSLASTTPETFPEAPANDATKAVLLGTDGVMKIKVNRLNGRLATSSTPESLITIKEFMPPHDILYYVNKDDPRGPIPADPTVDPQYENWETALRDWAAREKIAGREISFAEPPTEADTFSSDPALAPTVNIISPSASSSLNSRTLHIEVNASAPRGVAEVTYRLDGNMIGVGRSLPFIFDYYLKSAALGAHTLSVIATDDIGNSAMQEITFDLDADLDAPSFQWVDGSPLTIRSDDFPRSIGILPFRWSDTKTVAVQLISADSSKKLIYTFDHNDNLLVDKLNFSWKNSPGAGLYTLTGILTDTSGKTFTKSLDVIVE